MRRKGPLHATVAPLMLSSAALADLVFLWCVSRFLALPLPRNLGGISKIVHPDHYSSMVFVLLIPLFWFVCEVLLEGRSPGRSVLGLHLVDKSIAPMPLRRRITRAFRKISVLGVTGVNPFRTARYNRVTGATWISAMSPGKPRPLGEWEILFRSGSLAGKKSRLSGIKSFAQNGRIRFGRKGSGWADIAFGPVDERVSAQHCFLFVRGGRLYIQDGNGAGKPSSNGTFVDGRRLKPCGTMSLSSAKNFAMADITVELRK